MLLYLFEKTWKDFNKIKRIILCGDLNGKLAKWALKVDNYFNIT